MPKPRQNKSEQPIELLKWHPIPKLESLEYAHPNVKEYIERLVSTAETISMENRVLQKEVNRLNEQLRIYKARLFEFAPKNTKKDSHNSHQPPSRDHFQKLKKTKSLREKTFRQVGGQPRHVGSNLKWFSEPNEVKTNILNNCLNCKNSLKEVNPLGSEKRQVIDLIPPKLNAIEYHSKKRFVHIAKNYSNRVFPRA